MSYLKLACGIARTMFFNAPFSANFKITERCNLRCPTCGIWRHASRDRELSTDQIRVAMQNLKKLGLTRLVITGGEPCVRKDLVEIVRLAAHQGLSVTLLTNGLLLNEQLLEALFNVGLEHIGISLDFLTPEKQNTFYGSNGAWQRITDAIKLALKVNNRGLVYTMTTLMPTNIDEVLPLFHMVEKLGAHFVINPVMGSAETEPWRLFSGHTTLPKYTADDLHQITEVYGQLISFKRKGHALLVSEKFLNNTVSWLTTNDIAWKCHAGLYYFTIFSDGGVAPCNEYPAIIQVDSPDFVDRFLSNEFQLKATQIRTKCSGCTFSCWRELSTLLTDPQTLVKQTLSYIRQIFF